MAIYRVYPSWLTNSQGPRIAAALFILVGLFTTTCIVRERKLRNAFRKGSVPSPGCFVIERKELAAKVKQILQPPEGYGKYHLIVGAQGAGKTTLVRQVGHECSGIIFVSIPNDVSLFDEAFARAINWTPAIGSSWLRIAWARFLGTREFEGCEKPRF